MTHVYASKTKYLFCGSQQELREIVLSSLLLYLVVSLLLVVSEEEVFLSIKKARSLFLWSSRISDLWLTHV